MQLWKMLWSLVLQPQTGAEAFTTTRKQKHPCPVYFQFSKLTDSTNFLLCWPGDYIVTLFILQRTWLCHIYPQRNLAHFGEKHNWKLSANMNASLAHIRHIWEWEISRVFLAYYYLWCMDPGETYWPIFQCGLEKCNSNVNGKSRQCWVFFLNYYGDMEKGE